MFILKFTVLFVWSLQCEKRDLLHAQSVGTPVPVYWITTVDSYSAQYMEYSITCCSPFNAYFAIDPANDHIVVAQPILYATVVQTVPSGIFTLSKTVYL